MVYILYKIGYTRMNNIQIISSKSSFKYVVTSSPDPNSIECYKDLLFKNGVTTVVRLCEKKYDDSILNKHGITVIDIPIADGSVPNDEIVSNWIRIIMAEMEKNKSGIAVHCMSGLGRAPLFVCVGLITFGNVDPIGAVEMVREKIPRALNSKQVDYVCKIKTRKIRKYCVKSQRNVIYKDRQCCIM